MLTDKQAGIASAVSGLLLGALLVVSGCNSSPPASAAGSSTGVNSGVVDPFTGNPVALRDGRRLFLWYNCYGCHGGHGGGGMGPSLRDKTWIYGGTDAAIFNSIAQGRMMGMPEWGTRIPQDQIWELVAYIKSMRTAAEPDPPVEPSDEEVPNPSNNTPPGIGSHQH
jgi:cytochrome c oxidase cbb3-type subunit III